MRNLQSVVSSARAALLALLAAFWGAGLQVPTAVAATAEAPIEASEVAGEATVASSGVAAEAIALDVLILRPMGLLATVAGAGFFVATLPISALTQQVGTARAILVDEPFDNTFERPLGRI